VPVADKKLDSEEREFERAVAKEVRHDLDNDNRPAIERHFEDLLDEIHTSESSSTPVGGPTRKEQDEAERGIREFCTVLRETLVSAMTADSLQIRHVTAEEAGIIVTAEDSLKNSWQVTFEWEGLEKLQLDFNGNGPRILSAVAGRCLLELRSARERWWRGRRPVRTTGRLVS
jgi:hypothetical protein